MLDVSWRRPPMLAETRLGMGRGHQHARPLYPATAKALSSAVGGQIMASEACLRWSARVSLRGGVPECVAHACVMDACYCGGVS